MNLSLIVSWFAAFAISLACAVDAFAQAPGEDPVVLKNKLVVQMMPTGGATMSGNLDGSPSMPSWLRARIARFEAKAFSSDTTGLLTDNDVVTTAAAQGMKKTCVQEIGSSTVSSSSGGFNRYGPQSAPQVVVLRGDLVNICN